MSSEALERAEALLAVEASSVRAPSWWFAAARSAARDVLALLAEVARLEQERRDLKRWNTRVVEQLAVAREREQRAAQLLDATEADALALLDQHASPEVHNETRARLIERAATRAALAEPGSVRPVEQARPGSASAAADELQANAKERQTLGALSAVIWSEPRQDYTGRFYRDGLGTGTGAEADALLNATLAEPEQAQSRNTPPSDDSAADTVGEPGLLSSSPHPASASGSASATADESGETPRGGCPNCGGPLTVENFAEGSVVRGECGYSRVGHWGGGEITETPCRRARGGVSPSGKERP